ncbi:MAG: hypothetical protein JXB39_14125 [Deltaproteobacteria bacterium]|nr:hypothetical protein [Deltaproteobacteria bacterium]
MRDAVKTLLALLLVLLAGWIGYRLLFGPEPADPLLVQSVQGDVVHITAGGSRSEARPGLALSPSEHLETSENGRADVSFGGSNTIVVHPGSTVRVLGVTREGVRMELDGGRVTATVRPGRGSLGIVNRGRELVAQDADFAVGVGKGGALATEIERGTVVVRGVPDLDRLDPGQRLSLAPDGSARLAPVPESLLLQVAWPDQTRTREAEVTVRGRTDPGAEVRVGSPGRWMTVIAASDGTFEATIPLSEGTHPVEVVAVDPLGRTQRVETSLTRDSKAPPSTIEVRY